MYIYYITIFLSIFLGYIYSNKKMSIGIKNIILFLFFIFVVIVYGSRYEVGVDWFNYINVYNRSIYNENQFSTVEIGYKWINIYSYYFGDGIKTVIFISTIIFSIFTLYGPKFLRINPFYFFSLIAPFHLVMSGVNYTRQSIALSVMILAFSFIIKNNKCKFILSTLFASTFHFSAIVFLPLIFIYSRKRYLFLSFLVVIPPILFFMIKSYNQYIETQISSSGLYLRLSYLLPIILYCGYLYRKFKDDIISSRLYLFLTLGFFLLIFLSFISSTLSDRICYYFIIFATLFMFNLFNVLDLGIRIRRVILSTLFSISMFLFVIWCTYSGYIVNYKFKSYLFEYIYSGI